MIGATDDNQKQRSKSGGLLDLFWKRRYSTTASQKLSADFADSTDVFVCEREARDKCQ